MGCAGTKMHRRIYISVPDQKLMLFQEIPSETQRNKKVLRFLANYPVSTSKYGVGSRDSSYATPLGKHRVAKKIGQGAAIGAKFKDRKPTGEIVPIDAPGRDPIVTRILWLDGLEAYNRNSFARYIYIHGTPEERNIGRPSSYGCIRMRSRDVVNLYNNININDLVDIQNRPFSSKAYRYREPSLSAQAMSPLPIFEEFELFQ